MWYENNYGDILYYIVSGEIEARKTKRRDKNKFITYDAKQCEIFYMYREQKKWYYEIDRSIVVYNAKSDIDVDALYYQAIITIFEGNNLNE